MMKLKHLLYLMMLGAAAAGSVDSHAAPASILQIRDSLHNTPLVFPESFETDVRKMQENWYLKNYADIDREADSRNTPVTPTDEEIIARLRAIPTTIEMPFNSVVKSNILNYVERKKQLVENMLGMSLYYMPIFEQALDRNGCPLELKYLPVIESALNPDAVSRVGATGLWQFMLPTATGEGLEVNTLVDQRRDPYASSEAAARYLKKLYGIFGDWSLAIAAYNCGPGNVSKAMKRAGAGSKDFWAIYPYLPAETRGYVPGFIAANYAMNYYHLHNISPALARKPIVTDTVHVTRRVHFEQIRDVLGIPMEELETFNPQYRTGLIPGDIRPYSLVLPSLQVYAYIANEDSIVNHNAEKYAHRDIVEPATANSGNSSANASKGQYIEELVVKYHTVKRGETLNSIAKLYGVTAAEIRKTNKMGRKVVRGQKLRINTYQRRYVQPEPETKETNESSPAVVETPVQPVAQPAKTEAAKVEAPVQTQQPEPEAEETQQSASAEKNRVADAMAGSRKRKQEQAAQAREEKKTESKPKAETVDSKKNAKNEKTETTSRRERAREREEAKPTTHSVRRGETLSHIADKYGVSVAELRKANNIKGDKIDIGDKINIPKKKTSKSRRR